MSQAHDAAQQDAAQLRAERQVSIRNTVVMLVLMMVVLVGLFVNRVLQPRVLTPAEMVENGTVIFSLPREISAFELLDHRAEPFTNAAFDGAWTLVFFGFTHCPDICPATLAQFNQLDKELADSEIVADTRYLLVL